ncbi:MAG: hypothetical protein ABJB12_02010 [Pseudomonadota bacterium]
MSARSVFYGCVLLALGQGCNSPRAHPEPAPSARATLPASPEPKAAELPSPTRLASLPISAFATTLAVDDDAVYLLTSHAAYQLVEGQPPHGLRLELGVGPALTASAFVFWSDGGIWRAPKQGGVTRRLAQFPHQPQYFVASGEAFAWVDQTEEGMYSIQALVEGHPRALVTSKGEIRALNMVGDAVYFVQRPSDTAWRFGVVHVSGGAPEYATERTGRAPALLTGVNALYYYDLDQSKILERSLDFRSEQTVLDNFVCSPIHASSRIFCGCVEGLFQVSKETRQPTVLARGRPGTITSIASNPKRVVWAVDLGQDQLAVDALPIPAGSAL